MPMRDRADVVGDAVRSVLAQSHEHFELIVVDDGSRDDSLAVVRGFTDTRIRLLESGQSSGVSAARNRGLAAARGELMAYLDPARSYIVEKFGCGRQGGFPQGEGPLTKKVTVIVSAHGGRGNRDACIESLKAYSRDPLVQVFALVDPSHLASTGCLTEQENAGVKTIVADPGFDLFQAVNQAVRVADPESDLMLLDPNATLMPGTLSALQKAAYAGGSIAMAAPQQVVPGGDPSINTHVPYAFDDVPCDIALSHHHSNVEPLPLFHSGGPVDLNFASFFCVYIKRDAWELCGSLDVRQERESQFDRIMCEFVRHVLGRRIVYTPDAVVLIQSQSDSEIN
jgi:GT2 family glycosyltransferase